MNNLIEIAGSTAIVLSLGAFATASNASDVMRWSVDVKGLEATYWDYWHPDPHPDPITRLVDVYGYFDAEDKNGDGKIVISEVLAIQPMVGRIYPSVADTWVSFLYDPAVGLSYKIDGYHYNIDFGREATLYSDISIASYKWTALTVTTIGQPTLIPEPSSLAMTMAGLGLLWLALASRAAQTAR